MQAKIFMLLPILDFITYIIFSYIIVKPEINKKYFLLPLWGYLAILSAMELKVLLELPFILIAYLTFSKSLTKINYQLLTQALFTAIYLYLVDIIMFFIWNLNQLNFTFKLYIHLILYFSFLLITFIVSKSKFFNLVWDKYFISLPLFSYLLITIWICDYITTKIRLTLDSNNLLFISLLIIAQIIVTFTFFVITIEFQKEHYKDILRKDEINNQKIYIKKLEENQSTLRKFRHDYKNLLLSLKESNSEEIREKIEKLEKYSEPYLNSLNYKDSYCQNISNETLKNLFIAKLQEMASKQLNYQFYCPRITCKKINMDIYDCIRMIGILIDNAIEAAEVSELKMVEISVFQNSTNLDILISNSTKEKEINLQKIFVNGFSSKDSHSGIGLSTVKKIQAKYPAVFTNFSFEKQIFSVNVIIEEDE